MSQPVHKFLRVHVIPNARESSIIKVNEASYEVKVNEVAAGGAANKRLLEILSKHLGVPKSRIVIVRGARSRDEILELVT